MSFDEIEYDIIIKIEWEDCFNQDPHNLAGQQKQNHFSENAKIIDYFM